jgi:phosphatidate cytidylyltransferase
MIPEISANLKHRLIVSVISIFVLIVLISLSPYVFFRPVFAFLMAGIVSLAVWEFYHMAKTKGYQPEETLGIIGATAYIFATFIYTQTPTAAELPTIVLFLFLLVLFGFFFVKGKDPFLNIGATVFGMAYLVIPLSCLMRINYYFSFNGGNDGRWWVFYLLAVTKMTDVGGYIFGKKFGVRKMTPYISPKKTWAGAVGGVLFGLATSIVLHFSAVSFFSIAPLGITFFQSIWLGLLLSLLGQFGDLSESLLKRNLGVKDSNHLPGVGGMLDMLDSLIFTAPAVYLFLRLYYP